MRVRAIFTSVVVAVTALFASLFVALPAHAVESALAGTSSSTWQTNGIVRTLGYAGGKVFVGGQFTSMRPPGAAQGVNEVPRTYLAVLNSVTGALDTSFAHTLNGAVWAITPSPDGSRVYVGGDFTQVDGQTRTRLAAFSTSTGALISTWRPSASYRVNAIAASADTVWLGGSFQIVNSAARSRLASVSATNGALLPFDPGADTDVDALLLAGAGSKLFVGGKFSTIGGEAHHAVATLEPTTGAVIPLPAETAVPPLSSACQSMTRDFVADATTVYAANAGNGGGCFDGTFAIDIATGTLKWRNSCLGATEALALVGGWLYKGSHAHDCSADGGFPQSTNRFLLVERTSDGSLGPWYPQTNATGVTQVGPLAMATDGKQLFVGGDFTTVNGAGQQGVTRFDSTPDTAPSKPAIPKVSSTRPGVVKVMFPASLDIDDENLVYRLYRSGTTTPVKTWTLRSRFWDVPTVVYTDSGLTAGARYTYRLEVTDGVILQSSSNSAPVTVAATTASYPNAVAGDWPSAYWRLEEGTGTVAADSSGSGNTGTYANVTLGQPGGVQSGTSSAAFNGANSAVTTTRLLAGPTSFTVEAWVNTTSSVGGKILGFGNSQTGTSSNYDRHLYMADNGTVRFGVYNGGTYTVASKSALNDGKWHHLVGTMQPGELLFYVDGVLQGKSNPSAAQGFSGYWRIGGDNINGWPSAPASAYFSGLIDDVAIYPRVLSSTDIGWHSAAAGGNQPPSASFAARCADLGCALDATASTDTDGNLASYDWDFGDGSTGSGVTPSHTYAAAGSYPVTLTVTDDGGVTDSSTHDVTVTAPVPNVAPVAAFTSSCTDLGCSFDGAGSVDGDGDVASYAWDFGDGSTGSGVSPKHTYAAAGSYPVTLTVTDDKAATGAVSHDVTVTAPVPNVAPVAAFTSSCTDLGCSFDGAGSVDGDGDVASYAWDFGDGSTGSGVSPKHTYAAAGSYPVTLTVTDDKAATGAVSHDVTVTAPVPNVAPVAAFTSSCTDLGCSFDGAGSVDGDGDVASYAWDFGDGSTGSGVSPKHTYAAAGSYPVTLTVTDDKAATGAVSHDVTVTAPPAPLYLARDSFARNVTGGLGTADTGGPWTIVGSKSRYAVSGDAARLTVPTAGWANEVYLNSVSSTSADSVVTVATDKAPTGSGVYLSSVGRKVAGVGDYRAKVRLLSSGQVRLSIVRVEGTVETAIRAETTVAGLSYALGDRITIRFQVSGVGTTSLAAKVWKAGSAEPTDPQLSGTDGTASLQVPGSVGFISYLSGSTTNAPVVTTMDDLAVKEVGAP